MTRHDAGADGGREEEAVWLPLEGLPEGCELAMAADPEAVIEPFELEPCPNMSSGCRQFVVDRSSRAAPPFVAMGGKHDGEHGYIWFSIRERAETELTGIARDDGRILTLIRSPLPRPGGDTFDCYRYYMAPRAGLAALTVQTTGGGTTGESVVGVLEWGSGEPSFRVLATFGREELGPNTALSRIVLGEDFIVSKIVYSDLVRVGFDGSVHFVRDADGSAPNLQHAAAGDAFFYTGGVRGSPSIWVAARDDLRGDGEVDSRVFYTPPDGATIGSVSTDGRHLVWAQMYGYSHTGYERIELWAAPFTTDPDALEPRRVMPELPVPFFYGYAPFAAHGRIATGLNNGTFGVYSLDTGEQLGVLRPPPETEWRSSFIYIGPEEVAMAPSIPGSPPESLTVQFIDYDALEVTP